jgi:hypothetical protein
VSLGLIILYRQSEKIMRGNIYAVFEACCLLLSMGLWIWAADTLFQFRILKAYLGHLMPASDESSSPDATKSAISKAFITTMKRYISDLPLALSESEQKQALSSLHRMQLSIRGPQEANNIYLNEVAEDRD